MEPIHRGNMALHLKHYGAIGDRSEPDEIIPVTIDQCPRCSSYFGDTISVELLTIEHLP